MNVVRRALAAAAISGTALAGVATVSATAAQASTKVPARLSIKAPHAVTYNMDVTAAGKLTFANGTPAQGDTVYLQERSTPRGPWTTDANTGTTASDGTVSITSSAALTKTEQVRLVYQVSAKRWLKSAVKTVKVRYEVVAVASGTTAPATITATVSPTTKGMVRLQMKRNKGWRTIKTHKLSSGAWTFTVKKAGTYRVVKPAAHRLLTGASNPVTLS